MGEEQSVRPSVKEVFSDQAYAAGWSFVKLLPERAADKLFTTFADILARREKSTRQLRKNLARVKGIPAADVPDELIRDAVRSYARYWREAFRLPTMDPQQIVRSMEGSVAGIENFTKALEGDKGVVFTLPHSGNWDMAGVWLVASHGSFTTVAERLRPESLYQRFVDFRESLGFHIVPLTGGEVSPYELLRTAIQSGESVCLLGERDLRKRGVEVTFFGEKTRFPAGPAKLAKDTGAPLIVVHCWFTPTGWGLSFSEPLDTSVDLPAITQQIADQYERNIAAHPEDWHIFQPLWLTDLSKGHLAHIRGEE